MTPWKNLHWVIAASLLLSFGYLLFTSSAFFSLDSDGIAIGDRKCSTDEMCAVVYLSCGECKSGTAVNVAAIDKYRKEVVHRCFGAAVASCLRLGPPLEARCIDNRCKMMPVTSNNPLEDDG